jgi:hypothetical protein
MDLSYIKNLPLGGFNYDNCLRNNALEMSKPGNKVKTMKTGTTICGVVFKVSHYLTQSNLFLGWSHSCC